MGSNPIQVTLVLIKMKILVTKNNIHIEDSYKVINEFSMNNYLINIRNSYTKEQCSVIHNRSIGSLKREWQAHNLLYELHYKRNHTKDVDLNYESFINRVCYFLLSKMYKIKNIFK